MVSIKSPSPLTTCLWFNGNAEEAVAFYAEIFAGTETGNIPRYGEGAHFPAGTAITVPFKLAGQAFLALNGGPQYPFTPAISLVIHCEDQAELDHYWNTLSVGGSEDMCGWLKDRFGLSWQVVPKMLGEKMGSGDPVRSGNMMRALLQMRKLDIAALEAAYNG